MKFENQLIERQAVTLDGNEFIKCHLRECELIFHGIATFSARDTHFEACTHRLAGPARDTIEFMTAMYQVPGMRETIERTFAAIRVPPKP